MRALAIILGMIALLFGLAVGGCAVVIVADSINTGIEGPGAAIAVMALVCLAVAAGLIAFAMWLFRWPKPLQRGEDSQGLDSDPPNQ